MSIEYSPFLRKFRFNRTHIRKNNVFNLKSRMNWKGSGKPEDPIVIDNIKGLQPNLVFHNSDLCFVLRNVKPIMLFCKNTQNIVIENCKIYELDLQGCYNIYVRNNEIMFLKLIFTRESYFENNKINPESLSRLEVNYFDKTTRFLYFTYLYASIGLIISAIFSYVFFHWALSLLLLSPIIGFIYIFYIFKKREFQTKKMEPNTIINNNNLPNYTELTNEIVKEYQNVKPNRLIFIILLLIGGSIGAISGIFIGTYFAGL